MIIDKQLTFSDRQRLLATGYSTDTIDLGDKKPLGDDLLNLVVLVNDEVGATVFTAELQTRSDNATFTTAAALPRPAGQKSFGISLGNLALKRYARICFTLSGGAPDLTATAAIVAGVQDWRAVADSPRIA